MLSLFFQGPFGPWLPAAIYAILFATAAWDARTGIVPNMPLAIGALAVLVAHDVVYGWNAVLGALVFGAGSWFGIWLLNELWFRIARRDALGMGDAKWTALAIMTFGWVPALFAWFVGSWVAIAWIIGCAIAKKRVRKVYFAPFLFIGLTIGILFARKIISVPYPLMLP